MQNNKDSFFSMDRLVEFGIGMAMSQQIVQSMNNMMAQIKQPPLAQNVSQPLHSSSVIASPQNQVPLYQQYALNQQVSQNSKAFAQSGKVSAQVPPPLPQKGDVKVHDFPEVFYASFEEGKSSGPFSLTELARLVSEKKLTAESLIWKSGDTEWKSALEFDELLALIALVPPKIQKTN
jgi:hypothetical protein